MNEIDELKQEIIKLEKTSNIGLDLYNLYKKPELLHDVVFFSNEASKLKRLLKDEYKITV